METFNFKLMGLCLFASAVLLIAWSILRKTSAITREQNDNWRLNSELMEGLMYGFDLLMAHVDQRGFELDASVLQVTDKHYALIHERLPALLHNHYYYLTSPHNHMSAVIYLTPAGEIRFLCKSKVGPHAYGINSNYQYDPKWAQQVPFSNYPSGFGGLVGLVHELSTLVEQLQIGRLPMPQVRILAP